MTLLLRSLIFSCILFSSVNGQNQTNYPLTNGGKVSLIQSSLDQSWGIKIESPGQATLEQPHPIQIEYYEAEADIRNPEAGYKTVEKTFKGFTGKGFLIVKEGATFQVEDIWTIDSNILSVKRKLKVSGNAYGGFSSGIVFPTRQSFTYPDVSLFTPGSNYGTPEFLYDFAPAGMLSYQKGIFNIREEDIPIPVCGIYFKDGSSVAVMDPSPKANTTLAETHDLKTTMIDERFLFGAFSANENKAGGLSLAYNFPGSVQMYYQKTVQNRKRYHPIRNGFTQEYSLLFRMGTNETYHNFYSNTWRWGWGLMNPVANHYNIAVVQKSLVGHLAGLVIKYQDKVGIPFFTSMITGKNFTDAGLRDRDAVMGFVGKDLEGGVMLIRDSYEDKTARGREHYQLGMQIINTMIKYVDVSPPTGTGFNIETGKPSMTNPAPNHVPCCNGRLYLREFTDDMRWVLKAYEWELKKGINHYEWFRWCTDFGQWLLFQQLPDGSFPRSWYAGTGIVYDTNYQSTYNAMAFLVKLNDVTGGDVFWHAHGASPFLTAAEKAGDFCWQYFESKDQFIGGTLDNNNVMDKEAGTLSLEGFIALYEATKDQKWLSHAKAAADYAETWIYGWNVPMPDDETDSTLHWKKEASLIGANKINSHGSGVDQWMAGDVNEFARLYTYTQDKHYKDIARILLNNTKNMVALPGRMYDLYEPGAQQEHWGISYNRGHGAHRGALPWVTVNHITGIFALKDFDMKLFNELSQ